MTNMENNFKFNMNQQVKISRSGEVGKVYGRAEFKNSCNQFYVKYTRSNGDCAAEWFDDDELEAAS